MRGAVVVWSSWLGTSLFAITTVPAAFGADALEGIAAGIALGLFGLSFFVWAYTLARAAARTTRGDDVVIANLFLLDGPVPRSVRWHLFGSLAAAVAVAGACAVAEPFGVLVPMLPLGLAGLWGARHGEYRQRDGHARDATTEADSVS